MSIFIVVILNELINSWSERWEVFENVSIKLVKVEGPFIAFNKCNLNYFVIPQWLYRFDFDLLTLRL